MDKYKRKSSGPACDTYVYSKMNKSKAEDLSNVYDGGTTSLQSILNERRKSRG